MNCVFRWSRSFVVFSVLLLLSLYSFAMEPVYSDSGGTIPPLNLFQKTASVSTVRPGESVGYQLIVANNVPTYTGVLLGLTDTLPISFSVTGPVTASLGQAVVVDNRTITWTGEVSYTERVTISYQALVAGNAITGTQTNVVTLWEISHAGGAPPTEKVLTVTADVQVELWPLALPFLSYQPPPPLPLPALPTVKNGNFESGRDGNWNERNAGKTSKLIYRNGESITLIMPSNNGHYFAWLGGEPNATNELAQAVTLPAGYSEIGLIFQYWIWSEEDACNRDAASISIDNMLLHTLELCKGTISPVDATKGGWKTVSYPIPAPPQDAAKSVTIKFSGITNGSKNSNFFVDNVQLCSNADRAPQGTPPCP